MADDVKIENHTFRFTEPGDLEAYQRLHAAGRTELFSVGFSTDNPDQIYMRFGPFMIGMTDVIVEKLIESLTGALERFREAKAEKGGG